MNFGLHTKLAKKESFFLSPLNLILIKIFCSKRRIRQLRSFQFVKCVVSMGRDKGR